jgi:hypothetical protein
MKMEIETFVSMKNGKTCKKCMENEVFGKKNEFSLDDGIILV